MQSKIKYILPCLLILFAIFIPKTVFAQTYDYPGDDPADPMLYKVYNDTGALQYLWLEPDLGYNTYQQKLDVGQYIAFFKDASYGDGNDIYYKIYDTPTSTENHPAIYIENSASKPCNGYYDTEGTPLPNNTDVHHFVYSSSWDFSGMYTQDVLDTYNFTGFKIDKNTIPTSTPYVLKAYFSVPFTHQNELVTQLSEYIKPYLKDGFYTINGMKHSINLADIQLHFDFDKNVYYGLITIPSCYLKDGSNTVTVGANFPTAFNQITGNTLTWYGDSWTFTASCPSDKNGDGIDDNTGQQIQDDTDVPNRDNYPDGIIGDVQYGFAMLFYYIKLPFVYLGKVLTTITDSLKSINTYTDGVKDGFNTFFSVLPSPIPELLTGLVVMVIFITLIAWIRGK